MARGDDLRLMTKVALLYHEQGLTQAQIAGSLRISQATCSRLLERAVAERIVRVIVTPPAGTCVELERALQADYGLKEAVVVDVLDDEEQLLRGLGVAAAAYLETSLGVDDVIGISSWSATLLATVDAMTTPGPTGAPQRERVVQILGGVGSPSAEVHATHLTQRLARLVGADAVFLPAPGVVGSAAARRILVRDAFVKKALGQFERVTLALVGIGALRPSSLLARSGNVFKEGELRALRKKGAVGDICLRFFDGSGTPVVSNLDGRVIGMELFQLRSLARSVGVAGGLRKYPAILGALRGRYVNVLITDRRTAERLIKEKSPARTSRASA